MKREKQFAGDHPIVPEELIDTAEHPAVTEAEIDADLAEGDTLEMPAVRAEPELPDYLQPPVQVTSNNK